MRHFLSLLDLTPDEVSQLLDAATRLKAHLRNGKRALPLAGKIVGLIFEKPSLRTRVSFETGVAQLGGSSIFMGGPEAGFGTRESIPDYARTMSQYVDAVVLRTFKHSSIEEFAAHATVPVVNGLSDYYHPCQALGDLLTMRELFPKLAGRTMVFIGDGNNVARSLAVACGKLNVKFILSAPVGYGFDEPFLATYRQYLPSAQPPQTAPPAEAVPQADFIYTDVWTSMGQEDQKATRLQSFTPFQVNAALLALAPAHAKVMHCLPAHRGEEITDEILDSDRSVVFPQAGNRMHAQKALLQWLMADKPGPRRKPAPRPRKPVRRARGR